MNGKILDTDLRRYYRREWDDYGFPLSREWMKWTMQSTAMLWQMNVNYILGMLWTFGRIGVNLNL